MADESTPMPATENKTGRVRSGKARMDKLSKDERHQLARQAAQARWGNDQDGPELVTATHGDPDHPLRIGEVEIPCYVLADERRVIIQSGMLRAMSMAQGTASAKAGGDRLSRFIDTKGIREYVPDDLREMITNPIRFRVPSGSVAYGYEATILADLCAAVVLAADRTKLNYQQTHIVEQCRALKQAFAKVGIVALVDEATGFQRHRNSDALQELLRKFISEELRRWVKTFPDEFYRELFRVYGITYSEFSSKRPQFVGKLTNDLVYDRLAPEVRTELEARNPKLPSGRRRYKNFQWLTEDIGHPKLREHLFALITLLRVAPDGGKDQFYANVQRALPRYEDALKAAQQPALPSM